MAKNVYPKEASLTRDWELLANDVRLLQTISSTSSYRVGKAYDGLNFDLLEIDWTTNDCPIILLKALNAKGKVVFDYRLKQNNMKNKN